MKEKLDLSQSQQLTQHLSPRQLQLARVLEMTAPELEEEVRRQLDDNPALEAIEPSAANDDNDGEAPNVETIDSELPTDYDADDDPADWQDMGMRSGSRDLMAQQFADDTPELMDYLSSQITQSQLPEHIANIALYIIGNLDENGYLTRTLSNMADDIAINAGVEVTDADMRQAFDAVRALDPAGVGAVDLRDCLLLQLRRVKPSSLKLKIATSIVADNFDLLSKKHYDRLQAELGISNPDDLRDAMQLIRSLNPKPGSALAVSGTNQRMSQITPDVSVEEDDGGRLSVSLVSSLPQLQIERSFALEAMPQQPLTKGQSEAAAFMKLKRDDAEAFISALKQRGNTLLRVTEAIVRRQADFIRTGDKSRLRPMILKDIEKDTGIELSAISRATAGKYVATAMGTFPLKMFFNEAPSDDSEASSHELMHALREIIAQEDPNKPYSDQALQEEMERRGYHLARRTITKYRERMGISVGRLRRKL